MISDPKLPFNNVPTTVETAADPSAAPLAGAVPPPPATIPPQRLFAAHLWLRRVGVLLFVFLCATFGVMLMIVPWRPEWSDNPLLLSYPALRALVGSGFVRGVVTGLGLINVWIGFWEALRYRED
ncbi:MAG: hypothetical protein ABSD39_07980 [Terriglobales bacterium]|jgi:hypothetical protein